ncbi:type I-B CRISPR-associated protein Cas8b1/Cst1 [bacterium]|jgi:uncharacterized protein|nr:type I-B CRISPR-associated protein Cas8b1/Cst1 [bacterium]
MEYNFEELKYTVEPGVFIPWQEVDIEIYSFSDLGITVVINNEYTGLIYGNQVYGNYQEGERLKAYIKCIREDGRIDVSLQPKKGDHVFSTADKLMQHLEELGGKSPFNDKSSPEDIRNEFQVSKMVFKQAIGNLYKRGKIRITAEGIEIFK